MVMSAAPGRPIPRWVAGVVSAAGISALLLMVAPPMAVSQQAGGGATQPNTVANELLVKFVAGVSPANAAEILQRAGAQVVGAPTLEGRLYHVRLPDPSVLSTVKSALEKTPGVEYVELVGTVTTMPKDSK